MQYTEWKVKFILPLTLQGSVANVYSVWFNNRNCAFSQQTVIISLRSFHRFVFLMETHWILCEVQTDVYTGHNDVN